MEKEYKSISLDAVITILSASKDNEIVLKTSKLVTENGSWGNGQGPCNIFNDKIAAPDDLFNPDNGYLDGEYMHITVALKIKRCVPACQCTRPDWKTCEDCMKVAHGRSSIHGWHWRNPNQNWNEFNETNNENGWNSVSFNANNGWDVQNW